MFSSDHHICILARARSLCRAAAAGLRGPAELRCELGGRLVRGYVGVMRWGIR